MRRLRVFVLLAPVLCSGPAIAQNSLPGLENFTLERPRPPAPTPSPTAASPSPTPFATPSAPAASPTPRPTATPAASPTAATAAPSAAPASTPSPAAATPPAAPSVGTPGEGASPAAKDPIAIVTPDPVRSEASGTAWPWLAFGGVALAVLAGIGGFLWGRRRRPHEPILVLGPPMAAEPDGQPPADGSTLAPAPAPAPIPSAPTPSAPTPSAPDVLPGGRVTTPPPSAAPKPPGGLITTALRPEILFEIRPVRAGIDSLRASLDFELVVGNAGRAAAGNIVIEAWLTAADNRPEAIVAELIAQPLGAPMVAPFTLPPSGQVDLAGHATAARDTLATISAGERRLFVPMLVVRAVFADHRGADMVASHACLVGVERPGQARLAPLALDRGARTYEQLAARRL